ncbi:MAG: VOC family protein [Gammaproteobacteria bacterium]|nr:VOC family protein [Gammaproteobacteria bacterium]MDH3767350.1 VOC family protein [Gammaproteobacteria bacterium]
MTTKGNRSGDLRGIAQVALATHDVDRAAAFYRDILGLTELFCTGGMAFLSCGGIRLMISPPSAEEFDHASSILYFDVVDIQAAYEDLQARGVEFVGGPHCIGQMGESDVWNAHFRDPDGNLMSLTSTVSV